MKCLSKIALFAIAPLFLLCFSSPMHAAPAKPQRPFDKPTQANKKNVKKGTKPAAPKLSLTGNVCSCPAWPCPISATDYTVTPVVHLEFLIDDLLPTSPVTSGTAALAGFADFLGFDTALTQAYWELGLEYVKCRFGIDATGATFDPVYGLTFLTVASDGSSVQTPEPTATTNVVISPISFTGTNTYRVVESTAPVIPASTSCYPLVRLAEFVVTFLGDVNVGGTWGAEASATGSIVQPAGTGIAFGRYVIRGADGFDHSFDMRSWVPNYAWPTGTTAAYSYYTERFQINPLEPELFIGSGMGTLTIVAPTGPVTTAQGAEVYPWYIRNDWWLGPSVAYPKLTNWVDACPNGNLSLILSPEKGRCPSV